MALLVLSNNSKAAISRDDTIQGVVSLVFRRCAADIPAVIASPPHLPAHRVMEYLRGENNEFHFVFYYDEMIVGWRRCTTKRSQFYNTLFITLLLRCFTLLFPLYYDWCYEAHSCSYYVIYRYYYDTLILCCALYDEPRPHNTRWRFSCISMTSTFVI